MRNRFLTKKAKITIKEQEEPVGLKTAMKREKKVVLLITMV